MYVDIDSTGNWILDDNYYTWLVYYFNIRALFTFNKNSRCIKYYLLCNNLGDYWDYYDYYNQILIKTDRELTWIEKKHKYYIEIKLKILNNNQFGIYIINKKYLNK